MVRYSHEIQSFSSHLMVVVAAAGNGYAQTGGIVQYGHRHGADAAEAQVGGGRAPSAAHGDEPLVAAHLTYHICHDRAIIE